jgi:sugar transferase (PEP-CTERM system associated)
MNTRINARAVILLFADIAFVILGFVIAAVTRLGFIDGVSWLGEELAAVKIVFALIATIGSLYLFDLYDFSVISSRQELLVRLIQSIGITWLFLAVIYFFFPQFMVGRGIAALSAPIILLFLLSSRLVIHYYLGHPDIGERVILVGTGPTLDEINYATIDRRDLGYRIVGYVSGEKLNGNRPLSRLEYLGQLDDLDTVIANERISRVVVGVSDRRGRFPLDMLLKLRLSGGLAIEESTTFMERVTGKVHLDSLLPSWLIFSARPRETRFMQSFRDISQRILALTGLILSIPLALLTAIAVKLESRGPVFYKQVRVGKNGRPFVLVKFRSMRNDAETDGAVWASVSDDRTTRVGRVIRKLRFDEIPQFWNILKGDMSFVGPRPERPEFVAELAEAIPFYEYRHLVPPGLTGWAQVNYPYGASVEESREKLEYDLYYIKNQSVSLDLVILFETIKTILFGRGSR